MIGHNSTYEKEGWISITNQLPPIHTKVNLCSIISHDFNLEEMEWWTQGWLTSSGIWSMKMKDGLTKYKSTPTHWKEITWI